ncbi:TetR/AcrR family transcriptional regulator [Paenibacillus sp. FSL R7-0331]|uniref:TetR/AcrR family transcriptional regulator n=1 Tax=Paenibacillus sp. FSL R7-0331 TaxID=1536773 RepID=UPI0004F8FD9E|nr:TetR-like C-terminal domain-containing protein [Paenibacillus sp. FSL R7-0331]AIQ51324.1 hypothetical protein R70331_07245 [Paenibacillus sp. FSL R7-0331]
MKKVDRRVIRTKNSIRTAFLELIQSRDFELITVTDLAITADIDRKTFYLHYNSLIDVLQEFQNQLAEKVSSLLKNNQDFNIDSFFQGLNTIMMEDIGLYRHISKSTSYAFLKSECKDILKNTLKNSFYDQTVMSPQMFNVYSEYIASGIIGIYTDWLSSSSKMPLEELTETAKDVLLSGWEKIVN